MTDLLDRLGLTSRTVDKIHDVPELMQKKIDYKVVDNIICAERKRTYEYLRGEIDRCIQS